MYNMFRMRLLIKYLTAEEIIKYRLNNPKGETPTKLEATTCFFGVYD